jgi:RimJ/RimL family protein N-acetyltransferase
MMDFTLRKWAPSDLHDLVRYADNRNVARWLTDGFPHPYTEADGRSFLDSIASDDPVKVFAIEVDGHAVGSIGIFPQSDVHRLNAELGYWLAEPYWGRGIMPEAVRRVCNYGFRMFEVERIFARPFGGNRASQRVLEKAGFDFEARFEGAIIKDGERFDELYYAIRLPAAR